MIFLLLTSIEDMAWKALTLGACHGSWKDLVFRFVHNHGTIIAFEFELLVQVPVTGTRSGPFAVSAENLQTQLEQYKSAPPPN